MGYARGGRWCCETTQVLAADWLAGKAGRGDAERQGWGLRRQACISRGSRGKRLRSQSRGRGQGPLRTSKTSDAIREIELVTSDFSDRLIQLPSGYQSDRCRRCVGAPHQNENGRWECCHEEV